MHVQVWHKDVRFYRVKDLAGEPLAYFYFDPYSRPSEKRGGAWMDEVLGRSRLLAPADRKVRLPVAHMVCNQTPPVGDEPSLMTFREVCNVPSISGPLGCGWAQIFYFLCNDLFILFLLGFEDVGFVGNSHLVVYMQVETVFHEFGHALQHMLTRQDEGLVAGIRKVEWDAVELPSQFMENWCYHRYA